MNLADAIFDLAQDMSKLSAQGRDNLFSANHRNRMIEQHRATEAQWVTIEELERS